MEFKISPKLEENILEQFGLIIDEDTHKIFPIELLDESKNLNWEILENTLEYETYKEHKNKDEEIFLNNLKKIENPFKLKTPKKIDRKSIKKKKDSGDKKIYECKKCNKFFSGASGLWYHNVYIHKKPVNSKKRKIKNELKIQEVAKKPKVVKKPKLVKKLKVVKKPKKPKKLKKLKKPKVVKSKFDLNKFVEGEKLTNYWCANCDKSIKIKKRNGIGGHRKYCLNSDRAKQGVIYRKTIIDKEEQLKLLLREYLNPQKRGGVYVLEKALEIYNRNKTNKIIIVKKINQNWDRFRKLREKKNNILSAFATIMKDDKKKIINVYSFIIEQIKKILKIKN